MARPQGKSAGLQVRQVVAAPAMPPITIPTPRAMCARSCRNWV
jgi:hypothetical protein